MVVLTGCQRLWTLLLLTWEAIVHVAEVAGTGGVVNIVHGLASFIVSISLNFFLVLLT